jgi:hypothetical protein
MLIVGLAVPDYGDYQPDRDRQAQRTGPISAAYGADRPSARPDHRRMRAGSAWRGRSKIIAACRRRTYGQ